MSVGERVGRVILKSEAFSDMWDFEGVQVGNSGSDRLTIIEQNISLAKVGVRDLICKRISHERAFHKRGTDVRRSSAR